MVSVFDHSIFGGLFDDAEARMIWSSDHQIGNYLAFEAGLSLGLGQAGIVQKQTAEIAAKHVREYVPDKEGLRVGMERDGVAVPELVQQLKSSAPDLSGAIHLGATSQDVVDTALSMSLRDMNNLLESRLKTLSIALSDLGSRFGGNPMMGRTRMQAALMTRVQTRTTSWNNGIDENIARLASTRSTVERVQLGGAVGDNQQLNGKYSIVAKSIAAETGLHEPTGAWHTTRGFVADYANVLSLISGANGKIGQDICLMAQQGIDEIALSGGGGSSAMPHKQNPILGEMLVTLARFNATQLAGMHQALVHEQERSGSAWALEWMILPQMCVATARSIAACTTLCEQITRLGLEQK